MNKLLLVLLVGCSVFAQSITAQPLMQPNISLAQARKIADAVIAKCGGPDGEVTISIAVVDRAGQPVLQMRADTDSPHNWELVYRKAYTANSFRRTSLEWRDRTADSERGGQRMLSNMIPLGGGAPIMMGGESIGGVGVSGSPEGQPGDSACAEAGAAAIADELK